MLKGRRCEKLVSAHEPEELRTQETHQETEFVRHRIIRVISVDASGGFDENTPIRVIGGIGVDSVRIAKVREGFVGTSY